MHIQKTLWCAVAGRLDFRTVALAMVTVALAAVIPVGRSGASTPPQPVGWVIAQSSDGKVTAVYTGQARNAATNPARITGSNNATNNSDEGKGTGGDEASGTPAGGLFPYWDILIAGAVTSSDSSDKPGKDGKRIGTPARIGIRALGGILSPNPNSAIAGTIASAVTSKDSGEKPSEDNSRSIADCSDWSKGDNGNGPGHARPWWWGSRLKFSAGNDAAAWNSAWNSAAWSHRYERPSNVSRSTW
jgi:hypothetical protein